MMQTSKMLPKISTLACMNQACGRPMTHKKQSNRVSLSSSYGVQLILYALVLLMRELIWVHGPHGFVARVCCIVLLKYNHFSISSTFNCCLYNKYELINK